MTPMDEYDDIAPVKRTPTLNTKGLMLLPAHVDMEDYSHWLNDPEVVKYSELRHRTHDRQSCRDYIASFDGIDNHMWAINVIGANVHIGNITLHLDKNNNVGQMGMLIGEKWAWGRKYGREAWKAVIDWAKAAKIRRLEAGCMGPNAGMRKVMGGTGMTHLSGMERHFLLDGTPTGIVFYGIDLS